MQSNDEYGLLLVRRDVHINLSNPIALFESKRAFFIYKWSDAANTYIRWVHFTGRTFYKVSEKVELMQLPQSRRKRVEVMMPMNKFFKDFDDFEAWLGDYFVLFVDDIMSRSS